MNYLLLLETETKETIFRATLLTESGKIPVTTPSQERNSAPCRNYIPNNKKKESFIF